MPKNVRGLNSFARPRCDAAKAVARFPPRSPVAPPISSPFVAKNPFPHVCGLSDIIEFMDCDRPGRRDRVVCTLVHAIDTRLGGDARLVPFRPIPPEFDVLCLGRHPSFSGFSPPAHGITHAEIRSNDVQRQRGLRLHRASGPFGNIAVAPTAPVTCPAGLFVRAKCGSWAGGFERRSECRCQRESV